MLKPVVVAACLCVVGAAGAQAQELSGQEISAIVAGATVEIDTPAGTKLPVRYAQEGRVSGEARDLAWYLGSAHDTGRWWVTGNQLCHKWLRWFNGEPQCMRIARDGRIFRWRSQDGSSGTAAIVTTTAVAQASAGFALPRFARPAPQADQHGSQPALAGTPPRQRPAADPAAAMPPVVSPKTASVEIEPSPPAAAQPPPPVSIPALPPAVVEAPASLQKSPPPPHQAERPKPAPPARAEPAPPRQPLFRVANVRDDDVLNVRSGPSADFDIVGELPPHSRGIAVTSACQARWCPVQYDSTSGWVNSVYLAPETPQAALLHGAVSRDAAHPSTGPAVRESPEAPRSCLTSSARALLNRIEQKFGPVRVVSTCRPGATIAGTNRVSRHASGNAVDFDAGSRKAAILEWLIANHRAGGTMTYSGMDHIHVDIGPHFVSLAGGRRVSSWRRSRRDGGDDD